ncbi:class I ribonucleotide reductase maintenance protein YfaE [Thalassotalea sp. PLHSN55]|uniref:class I ribonucleotide reductase maintenance protein YfaE n=1 Tax=Thalassotalea sp. PLHSN55 TaxID=3435888 RepID=UPI003F85ED1D
MNAANASQNTEKKDDKNLKNIHIVQVDGQKISFLPNHNTLLECIESANIEVHYHCRDGYCGACRIRLDDGQIHYPNGEPLAYVGENEILPCCCVPNSNVTLSID